MSVLCGNHKVHLSATTHESVAEVRECFFGPEAGAEVHVPEPSAPVEAVEAKVVRDGTYTVTHSAGHTTLRLKTQPFDSKFAPGKQVAAYLAGSDNESDYVSFAFIVDGAVKVWKKFQTESHLVESLISAINGGDDVMVSANCFRCQRLLTVPESIASGWGPTCSGKGLRG